METLAQRLEHVPGRGTVEDGNGQFPLPAGLSPGGRALAAHGARCPACSWAGRTICPSIPAASSSLRDPSTSTSRCSGRPRASSSRSSTRMGSKHRPGQDRLAGQSRPVQRGRRCSVWSATRPGPALVLRRSLPRLRLLRQRRHAGRQPAGIAGHAPPADPVAAARHRGRRVRPGADPPRSRRRRHEGHVTSSATAAANRSRPLPACLEPVLRETHGLLVYQDDALGMVRGADRVFRSPRRIASTSGRPRRTSHEEDDRQLAEEFRQLCRPAAFPRRPSPSSGSCWLISGVTPFARVTRSATRLLAWQCAYAKAHQPLHFWTAVLNNNQGVYPRRVYVEAVKRAGFRMLLPCINRSAGPFTVEGIRRHSHRPGRHRHAAGRSEAASLGRARTAGAVPRPGRLSWSRPARSGGAGDA